MRILAFPNLFQGECLRIRGILLKSRTRKGRQQYLESNKDLGVDQITQPTMLRNPRVHHYPILLSFPVSRWVGCQRFVRICAKKTQQSRSEQYFDSNKDFRIMYTLESLRSPACIITPYSLWEVYKAGLKAWGGSISDTKGG
jgi:hypothetical protein